jgi:hypothetical protein
MSIGNSSDENTERDERTVESVRRSIGEASLFLVKGYLKLKAMTLYQTLIIHI